MSIMASTVAPTFSAIVTTYQRREFAIQALQSILDQTRPADEVILVIDGSTDGTAAAVRHQLPTVRVIEQPNLGRSIALNTAAHAANCSFLCFLDDDDLWHREKLEETERYLTGNPECRALRNPVWFFATSHAGPTRAYGFLRDFVAADLAECHAIVDSGYLSPNDTGFLDIMGNSYDLLLERNRGSYSSTVVSRDVYFRVGGFQPTQTAADDWSFFLNVARLAEWHTLPRRLGFQRLHSAQATVNAKNGIRILAAKVGVWRTGRPFPGSVQEDSVDERLASYGECYREEIQQFLWESLRNRRLREVRMIRGLAASLLPRWRDRAFVVLPLPITWRYSRMMNRNNEGQAEAPTVSPIRYDHQSDTTEISVTIE